VLCEPRMRVLVGWLVVCFLLAEAPPCRAVEAAQDGGGPTQAVSDPFLPGPGRVSLAVATGVPFWVMSEVSFGIGDHAALGLLAGATPLVSGFGLRPRGALALGENYRLLGVAPLIYYPESAGSGDWWLVRPSLLFERRFGGARAALGPGVVAAARNAWLFDEDEAPEPSTSPYPSTSRTSFDHGVWLTANVLGSVPVSKKTHLFVDGALVFDTRLALAMDGWVGGPPAIVFLGVETTL
jgi:hypothetical protein